MTPEKANSLPPKANLRVKEVADFLDVSDSTIYEMVNEGALPCLMIKGQKRVPRAEFERWYRAQVQRSAKVASD